LVERRPLLGKSVKKEFNPKNLEPDFNKKKLQSFQNKSAHKHLKFYEDDMDKNYQHRMLFGRF